MQKTQAPAAALFAALLLAACGQSGAGTTSSSALADTVASANQATGTMLCEPSQAQIAACDGLAAGAACSLTSPDGQVSVAGTCRASLDGTTVACGHNPPGPPAALVEACAGKAAGDACSATEEDGDSHDGTCVTGRDGTTLVCGRVHVPPQAAVDACATLAAGDACTMARDDGHTMTGVCALGPAGTGALACAPAQALRPSHTAACAGLAAGAACTLGSTRHPVAGTCVTPAAGGDAVCQAACAAFGGPFRFGPRPGGMGHGPGEPPTPPQAAIDACTGLAAGAACTMTRADGTSVTGTCRGGPDGTTLLACAPAMMGPGPMMGPHN